MLVERHSYLIALSSLVPKAISCFVSTIGQFRKLIQLCKRQKNPWIYLAKLFYQQTYVHQRHMTARWKIPFGMLHILLSQVKLSRIYADRGADESKQTNIKLKELGSINHTKGQGGNKNHSLQINLGANTREKEITQLNKEAGRISSE